MLKKFVRIFGGNPNKREIEKLAEIAGQINTQEAHFETLTDDALRAQTDMLRRKLAAQLIGIEDPQEFRQAQQAALSEILPQAFATVREASKRTLGLRHYDVQLIGGIALHQGRIAEMRTGEGKTLSATLPIYLNALALNPDWLSLAVQTWGSDPAAWRFIPIEETPVGRGIHLITVNDYLARRDARWMAPIYTLLGLSIGVLQMAARTENGKKAFMVDLERESPHEDQHQLRMVPRREAYAADITYGTNSEFGFDYLRDNMAMRLEDRVQRGHYYAIIDEVDNVLIDEARTPLIISGPSHDDTENYQRMAQIVAQLRPEDYEVNEKDRNVTLTESGETRVEELLGMPLSDPERPEDLTPEQERLSGYLEQALRAQFLFKKNKDYLVQGGKVIIIDEFTGRLMPGRRWSDGLHQAVEAKENVRVQAENITYATVTIQNFFRMYEKLCGMTGTAETEAEEFDKIYHLDVVVIPTNLEYRASSAKADLKAIQATDEQGYKYTCYVHPNDPQQRPIYWKRKDYPDVVYRTEEAKLRAIMLEVMRYHVQGRPILLGTTSVELSERISRRFHAEPLRTLAQVILLRDAWLRQSGQTEEGRQIPELQILHTPLEKLQQGTLRPLARQLEISLNPLHQDNLPHLLRLLGLTPQDTERLENVLNAGIPHQVLNARKHTEESQIIAGAGAFGAVTIATNMAGRGVDIKLGGDLAEEILTAVNRVLKRAQVENAYDMTLQERREALQNLPAEAYGIYESEVRFFLQFMDEMQRVRDLGGLHVIGSERHESRRIDNQLRGRAARQGDPGSSRFYLSMEDELMRLFGGDQADRLLQRLKVDDSMPLEIGMVSRLIEQAQTRVEGANFDTRKHLIEYDDVLNKQREIIYGQRDRIFTKDDLSADVRDMLQIEIEERVPAALESSDGPWKLLAWMESIQPTLLVGDDPIYPSFTLKLIAGAIPPAARQSPEAALPAIGSLLHQVIEAEKTHFFNSLAQVVEHTRERLDTLAEEALDNLDTYFSNLDTGDTPPTLEEILAEVNTLVHINFSAKREYHEALRTGLSTLHTLLSAEIQQSLIQQFAVRVFAAVTRRLGETLQPGVLPVTEDDIDAFLENLDEQIHAIFNERQERLVNTPEEPGHALREAQTTLKRLSFPLDDKSLYRLLTSLQYGSQIAFNRKTHRRVEMRTTRFTYLYLAAQLLENTAPEDITEQVMTHLDTGIQTLQTYWGEREFQRLSDSAPASWDGRAQRGLKSTLGETRFQQIADTPLGELTADLRAEVIQELGRQVLTNIFRDLLLHIISGEWIEYLTQMEGLRVAIGLEAYAQRDPLVQYKSRASEMFVQLMSNIRRGTVSRIFTFQPNKGSTQSATSSTVSPAQENSEGKKSPRSKRRQK
ncbi:MAG: hypothetical protein Fur0018_03630 [Anaerolineales bacterium]